MTYKLAYLVFGCSFPAVYLRGIHYPEFTTTWICNNYVLQNIFLILIIREEESFAIDIEPDLTQAELKALFLLLWAYALVSAFQGGPWWFIYTGLKYRIHPDHQPSASGTLYALKLFVLESLAS